MRVGTGMPAAKIMNISGTSGMTRSGRRRNMMDKEIEVYMDDMIMKSGTEEEHLVNL